MKRIHIIIILALLYWFPSSNLYAVDGTKKLYVGQSVTIDCPMWYGGSCDKVVTPSSNEYLRFTKDDISATITVLKYFSQTITVQIQFTESWISKGSRQHQTYTRSYNIICRTPNIKVQEEMTIELGETKQIEYSITPANITVPMNWGTLDALYTSSLIVDVSEDGFVTGKKAGKATVIALPYGLQDFMRTCTITVNDNVPSIVKDLTLDNNHRFYSVSGIEYTTPHKGINIIRLPDGKTKKIIVVK